MRHPTVRPRLGDLLLESGVIDALQLETALEHQKKSGQRLGQTLVERNFCAPEALWAALSKQVGLPLVQLDRERVQAVLASDEALANAFSQLFLSSGGSEQQSTAPAPVSTEDGGSSFLRGRLPRLASSAVMTSLPLDRQCLALFRKGTELAVSAFRALTGRPGVGLVHLASCSWEQSPPIVLVHGWPEPAAAGVTLLLASEGLEVRTASMEELLATPFEALILLPLSQAEKLATAGMPVKARLVVSSPEPEDVVDQARALSALAIVREPLDAEIVLRAVRTTLRSSPQSS